MPQYFRNKKELMELMQKNVRTFSARFSEEVKNKLIENTLALWYSVQPEYGYYSRMGQSGGVVGSITRDGVQKIGTRNYSSRVYFNINKIKMDFQYYVGQNGASVKYGRHQSGSGQDWREQLLDRMEHYGLARGHREAAHMLEETSKWVESQLKNVSNVEHHFSAGTSSLNLRLIKK